MVSKLVLWGAIHLDLSFQFDYYNILTGLLQVQHQIVTAMFSISSSTLSKSA